MLFLSTTTRVYLVLPEERSGSALARLGLFCRRGAPVPLEVVKVAAGPEAGDGAEAETGAEAEAEAEAGTVAGAEAEAGTEAGAGQAGAASVSTKSPGGGAGAASLSFSFEHRTWRLAQASARPRGEPGAGGSTWRRLRPPSRRPLGCYRRGGHLRVLRERGATVVVGHTAASAAAARER